jgi:hypothetical protein
MAQASAETTPGGFPLNGLLVGLGEFNEARSDFEARSGDTISIGGRLSLPYAMSRRRFFAERDLELQETLEDATEGERPVDTVEWVVNLRQDPESRGAVVQDSHVTLSRGAAHLGQLSVSPRADDDPPPEMLGRYREEFGDRYKMTESIERPSVAGRRVSSSKRTQRRPIQRAYGAVSFSAGVPVNGLAEVNEVDWLLGWVQSMAEIMSDEAADDGKASALFDTEAEGVAKVGPDEAANQLYALLKEEFSRVIAGRLEGVGAEFDLKGKRAALCNRLMSRRDYAKLVRPVLLERLTADLAEPRTILVPVGPSTRMAPMHQAGMRFIAKEVPEYFKSSVRYLGPLREDPRVTYPHSIAGSTHMPLGRKGESTASVLLQSHASGRRPVPGGATRYPRPDLRTTSSLEEAVRAWVREFGLGNTLNVHDQARYGVGFTIDRRDLTSVGTGVSQILPVIVLCLMARPGQLVLLEQPELHLNPALQQKLADFFLTMVRSGRQLIVETHSEYVVTRLRLRVAEDEKDEVRNLFNIVFAEQDEEGRTKFRVLDVDKSGALGVDEWPVGFFDQAGTDVEAMMRLALSRRRSDADKGDN